MKKTELPIVVLSLMLASVSLAAVPVPTANPKDTAERREFLSMAERNKLVNALFGAGKVARGCTFELLDPSRPYVASNLGLFCPGRLTYCDAITADCGQ